MYTLLKTLQKFLTCLIVLSPFINAHAQNSAGITAAQWREDLRFLQKTVHERYSNLFYNITEKQFDSAVNEIDKKIGAVDDLQMRVEFVKLVALFRVGHTAVRQRAGTGIDLKPWVHNIPVKFSFFLDGVFIQNIDEKYKEAAGGRVVKIGNTDIKTALDRLHSVISFENEQGFKSMIQFYMNVPEILYALGIIENPSAVNITYARNSVEKKISIPAVNAPVQAVHGNVGDTKNWVDAYKGNNIPLWLKEPGRLRYFEYLPESKTVYVRHSAVQDEPGLTIRDFFEKVFRFIDSADVDKFILDIRANGGGNNYLNKPVITGIIQSRKINRKGHLFVITGKSTFSAAQNLTNELEKYTEVIFAGEPTSENVNFYGDTRTEILPNSQLNINLSWLWWQNLDPRDKRQWTAPELAADMSFQDYASGRDPVMELVLNYKESEPVETQITSLVTAGKKELALQKARDYLSDPVHRYFKNDLENKINAAGYNLINQQKFKEANQLLGINVELFPASANVYDSYAESFLKLSNKEEAVKYYKLAVSKDPDGVTGENARNMLKEIENKKGF